MFLKENLEKAFFHIFTILFSGDEGIIKSFRLKTIFCWNSRFLVDMAITCESETIWMLAYPNWGQKDWVKSNTIRLSFSFSFCFFFFQQWSLYWVEEICTEKQTSKITSWKPHTQSRSGQDLYLQVTSEVDHAR